MSCPNPHIFGDGTGAGSYNNNNDGGLGFVSGLYYTLYIGLRHVVERGGDLLIAVFGTYLSVAAAAFLVFSMVACMQYGARLYHIVSEFGSGMTSTTRLDYRYHPHHHQTQDIAVQIFLCIIWVPVSLAAAAFNSFFWPAWLPVVLIIGGSHFLFEAVRRVISILFRPFFPQSGFSV